MGGRAPPDDKEGKFHYRQTLFALGLNVRLEAWNGRLWDDFFDFFRYLVGTW